MRILLLPLESDTSTSSAEPNVGSDGDGGRGSRNEEPGRLDSRGGLGGDRRGLGGGGLGGDRPNVGGLGGDRPGGGGLGGDRRVAGGLGGRAVGQMAPMLKPRLGDMYQEESEEDGESSINLYF